MNISSTPAVQSATAATQSGSPDAVNVLVLRKALDTQASAAADLIQSLPPVPPALATSGSLGTRLNTYA